MWEHFPKNRAPEDVVNKIVNVFSKSAKLIDSRNAKKRLKSNDVLYRLCRWI